MARADANARVAGAGRQEEGRDGLRPCQCLSGTPAWHPTPPAKARQRETANANGSG